MTQENKEAKVSAEARYKKIFFTSIIGIIANAVLATFKAIIGLISGSIAILMDAVNNLTDAGSSLITIVGAHFAAKDPDKKHPFGHGRSEYLATLLIGGLILYAGITALIESIKKIVDPVVPDYSTVALIIVASAVVVKLVLGLYVSKTGKSINSDSLVASGKDALFDSIISTSTLVAAIIYIATGISLEAYLGVIISIIILKAGIETLQENVSKILGEGAEVELVRNIKKTIAGHEGVQGAYDLVLNNYGPDTYLASVHIEVPDTMTANEFDILSRHLEWEIADTYGVFLTAVGIYSINTRDENVIAIRENVRKIVMDHPMIHQMHGFFLDDEKNMRFDMVISFDAKSRAEVHDEVMAKVKEAYPDCNIEIGIDSDFNEL